MALSDYLLCVSCENKTIYDANVDYEMAEEFGRIHDIAALCSGCANTKSLKLVDEPGPRLSYFLPLS